MLGGHSPGKLNSKSGLFNFRIADHYKSEESVFIKTNKFVSVKELAGEDTLEFLKRVQLLSRDLEIFKSEDKKHNEVLQSARSKLAVTLVVRGLSDKNLREKLVSNTDLDWDTLTKNVRDFLSVHESVLKLNNPDLELSLPGEWPPNITIIS